MEQNNIIKNIASTALAFGLSFTVLQAGNSTYLVPGYSLENHKESATINGFHNNSVKYEASNVYTNMGISAVELEARDLFGNMRSATKEERDGVEEYVNSISRSTGVNFFDLC